MSGTTCQAPRSKMCTQRLRSGMLSCTATIRLILLLWWQRYFSLPRLSCSLLSRLSPSRDQLTLSSQVFLLISPILAFIPDHKQHLEQLTPCAPHISWFTRQVVTRATAALFSCRVLTKNQHFILKVKKNNILCSHSELQHHLSCNQDIPELWCYKQTLLI